MYQHYPDDYRVVFVVGEGSCDGCDNSKTLDDDKRLVELRASGASFDEIAKSFGRVLRKSL
jgi:hypothetical protein